MARVLVTIWRGGNAASRRLRLDGVELGGWRAAPAGMNPPWTDFLVYELTSGAQYRLDFAASGPPESTFLFAVVRADATVLAARSYRLPTPELPAGVFFTP